MKNNIILFLIITTAVFSGIHLYHLLEENEKSGQKKEVLIRLKNEITNCLKSVEQTVESHIHVKESCVHFLEETAGTVSKTDFTELDKTDFLARRLFHLKISGNLVQAYISELGKFENVPDSLKRSLLIFPDITGQFISKENQVSEFYLNEFLPFIVLNYPGGNEGGEKTKYNDKRYRQFMAEKMDLTIQVLFEGQLLKNYLGNLIQQLEAEIQKAEAEK